MITCDLFGWKRICVGFSSFVYVLPFNVQVSGGGVDIQLTDLTSHFVVSVQSQDLDFQCHMSWSFFAFSEFSYDERRSFVLMILVELLTITV